MPKVKDPRFPAAATILAGVLLAGGCINLRVESRVTDPGPSFARAHAEIEAIHRRDPRRAGRPRRLCLLVYDADERQVVRAALPMWMVSASLGAGDQTGQRDRRDFGVEGRYNVDWRSIRGLSRVGPGLLVEVVDKKSRVLVWLK